MATFGKLTDGASVFSFSSFTGGKIASSGAPTSSGTVTSLTVRVWTGDSQTVKFKGVIYSDSSAEPGTLLAVSEESTVTHASEQEVTVSFTGGNQVSISSGTTYWIGVHFEALGGNSLIISRDDNANQSKRSTSDTYSDGTASTFGTVTNANGKLDVYVTYTEEVAGDGRTAATGRTSASARPGASSRSTATSRTSAS